jgi:TolB-like protein/tetratricopeptide (TPR) repeat protein
MPSERLRFGDFELDVAACELTRRGRTVMLERIPMELLLLMLERRDELVTREEIAGRLWGNEVFLDFESSINTAVLKLRRALKEHPRRPTFIQTVSGRGYRFTGPVTSLAKHPNSSSAAGTGAPRKRVMLAVLPFENLSANPEQEYFSDGLTEETICYLGRVNPDAMGVIARTSSMAYKRTRKNIAQIGRELGVGFILESSVRHEGNRLRITSQLIKVQDQTHLWASNFDCDATGFLSVQRELGMAIAEQVQIKLMPQAGGFAHSPVNMDAYDLYLRGRYHWNQLTPPGIRKGLAYFEQVVSMDPGFALAWAGIADCYSMLPIACDEPANEILPRALAAARRAVELNDGLAEAHSSLGTVKVWMDWDWPGAESALRRALELNPSYVQAHRYYACLLSHTGRHSEAAAEMHIARAMDPLSPIMHALSGHLRWHARDYRSALAHLRDAEAINSSLWIVHAFLGRVHECEGRMEESLREFQKAFDLSGGGNTEAIAFRARVHALTGNRAAAEHALGTLIDLSTRKYVPPCNIAMIYAGLGDRESALLWLEKGLEIRDVRLVFLLADPRWDALRQEPRFQNLSRRLNLLPPPLAPTVSPNE